MRLMLSVNDIALASDANDKRGSGLLQIKPEARHRSKAVTTPSI
jgi:hypothetical protein